MSLSEKRKGEWFVFSSTFLGALLPVIAVLSFANISPLISLGWSTVFAACFLGILVTYKKRWHEFCNLLLWKHVFFATIFISVLMYSLFFIGLEKTTPGNAAIIDLFGVFTAFLFFNVLRGERISFDYRIGAGLMIIGALVVLGKNFSGINIGDLLILGATFFAPIGNLYQQKARMIASGETIMFLRSILAVPCIFLLAYALGEHATLLGIQASLLFLFINGAVILGLSKVFWVEAIHRISVTKAQALTSVAPLCTLLFAWIILQQVPNIWQLTSLVFLFVGTLLLTDHLKLDFRKR